MIILKIPQTIFGVNNVIVCHLFKDRQYTFFIKFEVLLDLISVQLFFQCTIFLIISIYWMDVVFFYLLGSRHSFINSLSEREFLSGGFLMVLWTMFYRDNNMLSLFSIVFHWEQWLYIYIYIYVWKLNQTVLELDLWDDKFLFFPRRDLSSHHWYNVAPIA